jgi:Na+-driven multidrug efflux pump
MGTLLFVFGFSFTFIIRAQGSPLYATAMIVIATFVNVALDYVFIFRLSMGTRGAALATVLSEAIVVLMGCIYLWSRLGSIHVYKKNLWLRADIVKRIIVLGMAPAVMNIVSSIQLGVLNSQLIKYGGAQAVAAMGIVFSVGSLMMLFTFGMAAGMQPIIGYNYGAQQFDRVRKTFTFVCGITFLIALLFVLGIQIFSVRLVNLFVASDTALSDLATRAMRIFLSCIPFATITILGARYFQAIGKGWHSTFIGLTRQLFLFIPLLYILSRTFQLNGIFYTGPFTDSLAIVITALFLVYEMARLKRKAVSVKNA